MDGNPVQKDIFVSYGRREPDESWVQKKLVPALRNSGLSVLLDEDDFVAGQQLGDEMERAGRQCRYVLVVLSPAFDANRMAGKEAFEALQSGRLIPVVVRPTKPPAWMQGLLRQDWTAASRMRKNWVKLLQMLGAPYPHVDPPEPIPSDRRWRIPVVAAVILFFLGLGTIYERRLPAWFPKHTPNGLLSPIHPVDDSVKPVSPKPAEPPVVSSQRSPTGRSAASQAAAGTEIATPKPPGTTPQDVRVQAFHLAEAGRCQEAIPLLQRVASAEPRDGQVFYQLGHCEGTVDNYAAAREALARAEELGESPAKIASELAALALGAGDLTETQRQVDRALTAQPAYPAALLVRGDLFLKQRKYSEAVQVFNPVFERTHSAESCRKLADAYEKNGAPEQADLQRSRCGGVTH
jgi:Flp pilus assembly protein TadD